MRRSREFVFINGRFYIVDFLKGVVKQCNPLKWIDLYNYQVQNGSTYENFYKYKRNVNYVNYRNYNNAINLDRKENEQQHIKYTQPQLNNSHIYKHGKKKFLSEPIYGVDSKMDKISALCFWAFSSLQIKKFHADKVMLKCAPSIGSRHGIDLYVQIDKELYYYDSLLHCLLFNTTTTKSKFIKFHITFNPSIYMWRYKHSACIYDIYLDLGHVYGILKMVSSLMNISFRVVESDHRKIDLQKYVHLITLEFDI